MLPNLRGAFFLMVTLVLFAVARRPRVRPSGRQPRDAGS